MTPLIVRRVAKRPWYFLLPAAILGYFAVSWAIGAYRNLWGYPVLGRVGLAALAIAGLAGAAFCLKKVVASPRVDELVLNSHGISRVSSGAVTWSVPWHEIRQPRIERTYAEYSEAVTSPDAYFLVLQPAYANFTTRHPELSAMAADDGYRLDIVLSPGEASSAQRILAGFAGFSPIGELADVVPANAVESVSIHVNGWNKKRLRAFQLAALMIEVAALAVLTFSDSDPLRGVAYAVAAVVLAVVGTISVVEANTYGRSKVTMDLSVRGFRLAMARREFGLWWEEVAAVRLTVFRRMDGLVAARVVDFWPAHDGFAERHPELADLAKFDDRIPRDGGGYRLPREFSATAAERLCDAMAAFGPEIFRCEEKALPA